MNEKGFQFNAREKNNLPDKLEIMGEIPGYSIVQEGGRFYIINASGKKVSGAYHELRTFKVGAAVALLGRLGAMEKFLKIPQTEDEFFEESEAQFHEIEFDTHTQLLLAKTGAMKYIVDPISGKILSDGYHDFFRKDGRLFGRTGATEYEINIEKSSQITSEPNLLGNKI